MKRLNLWNVDKWWFTIYFRLKQLILSQSKINVFVISKWKKPKPLLDFNANVNACQIKFISGWKKLQIRAKWQNRSLAEIIGGLYFVASRVKFSSSRKISLSNFFLLFRYFSCDFAKIIQCPRHCGQSTVKDFFPFV